MPYKNKDKQRAYQREYQQGKRNGAQGGAKNVELLAAFRLRTTQDLVDLMEQQIEAVRADPAARAIEKARCLAFLAGVSLRTLEQRDLTSRIEALEAILSEPERKLKAV
jgi:hypothetical protein